MNTKELLIRYRDLWLTDKAAAEKFRQDQTDSRFHSIMKLHDNVVPLMKEAYKSRKESIASALAESDDIKHVMMDSITEDIIAEVTEKTRIAQSKLGTSPPSAP